MQLCRLDPALIRPGRVDFQALISHCTPDQIEALFYNFYPESSQSEAQNFINKLKELGLDSRISPAVLQGHFLMHKNTPKTAVEGADQIRMLIPPPKPKSISSS